MYNNKHTNNIVKHQPHHHLNPLLNPYPHNTLIRTTQSLQTQFQNHTCPKYTPQNTHFPHPSHPQIQSIHLTPIPQLQPNWPIYPFILYIPTQYPHQQFPLASILLKLYLYILDFLYNSMVLRINIEFY